MFEAKAGLDKAEPPRCTTDLPVASITMARLEPNQQGLGRASIEAYASIAIAITTAVFSIDAYGKALLLTILVGLITDLIWRSKLTVTASAWLKLVLTLVAVAIVASVSYHPLLLQLEASREIPENRPYFVRVGLPKPFVIDDSVWPPRIVGGYAKTRMIVDGRLLEPYANKYQLIGVVLHWRHAIPDIDEKGICKSQVFDIVPRDIEIPIAYNPQFLAEILTGSYSESFALLAVHRGLKPEQFDSLREAQSLGAKVIAKAAMVGAPPIRGRSDPYGKDIEDPDQHAP
ncbi:MAG: hypothetical protein M3O02_02390 [Acidobacteriota bacterium]|nr:hypothetical protein [Acidobacteriota bacterium]